MIIRSLCYFPPGKGKRSKSAGRSILQTLNRFRPHLLTISVAAFVMQSLPLIIPFVFQRYLPLLTEESEWNAVRWQSLASIIALTVAVPTLRSLAAFYFLSEAGRLGHQLVASLRELAFAQLMRLPVSYVERRGSGRILLRFIGDTDALRNWFSKTGPKLVADCATAALIAGSLLWVSWKLSLVLMVPLLLAGVVIANYAGSIRRKTRNARGRQSEFVGFVQMQLGSIRSSKLADARDPARRNFRTYLAEVSSLNTDRDRDAAKLEALAEFAIYFSLPLVVLAGLPLVWLSNLSPGDLFLFVWLTLHLVALLRSSFSAIVIHQKALVSIQRLYALLSRSAERGRSARAVTSRFQTLSIYVGKQRHDFPRGIHHAPDGVNAAQLIAALHGFEKSAGMRLTIDEIPIDQIEVGQRRQLIGCLPAGQADGEYSGTDSQSMDLKILIIEREQASLSALELEQLERMAGQGIILFTVNPRPNRIQCHVLPRDSAKPTQAV